MEAAMYNAFFPTIEAMAWNSIFDSINSTLESPNLNSPEGFFHYTTLSAAEKILNLTSECQTKIENSDCFKHENQNKYITLFASHFLFLNDEEELFQGIKCIKNTFNEAIKNAQAQEVKSRLEYYNSILESLNSNCLENAPNYFILCFCSEGNLLTQWEWYGKDCGISIEFDLENCLMEGNMIVQDNVVISPFQIYPHKIMYTDTEKNNAIKKLSTFLIPNEYRADDFVLLSLITAAHMKHVSFQNEKESRLLLAPMYKRGINCNKPLSLIKYRETNGIIKPYIEVHLKHKEKGKQPIKSVTVGPGHNQRLVYNAIQKLIHTRFATEIESIDQPKPSKDGLYEYTKIGSIEVRRSTIPFRG